MSVYFAQRRKGGLIKIGWSRSVPARVRVLKAKLLGSIKGERSAEKATHKEFAHLKVRGEWYRATEELLEYIRTEAQEHTPDAEVKQINIGLSKNIITRLDNLTARMTRERHELWGVNMDAVTRSDALRIAVLEGLKQLERKKR
ncbi:hypothetical protein LCGC14_2894630 [marine sediment metagenome]|uniref:Bacteriophage T5 Orf172 DNA-binding domain-containing protein n=1 Tax=marine sediment metagenome TaxID=412755 RepID=A0A0F8XWL9_9ZZZZ